MRELAQPPKLLDRLREACRVRHYSIRTEDAYHDWCRRFILFHKKRHPNEMGGPEVSAFLTYLAVIRRVGASTQNQALNAIVFLYRNVLNADPGKLEGVVRAVRPVRLPVVMSRSEVGRVIGELSGTYRLIALLQYGAGLRILEVLQLRAKDLEWDLKQIVVRGGKGDKDRRTMFPQMVREPLCTHLDRVRELHEKDLAAGFGSVYLPDAIDQKLKGAAANWEWQYVFPSSRRSRDPRSGVIRRHHMDGSSVNREVRLAAERAGLVKRVTTHAFRHSFATHLLEDGYDIRTVQELLGHASVETTMVYVHVLNRGGRGVTSPADRLGE